MGIIKAFIEAGIPIDVVGGTSIGALVGGLYCRDANEDTCRALLAFFAARMSSRWRLAYDLTYPYCAWFTGEGYNRGMWKILGSRGLEDFWLPFFCVSTDITRSQMRVHREGLSWRCIRASMSLSGFLPPLWDCAEDADGDGTGGSLLLDGGYVNNLPADVMAKDYDHIGTVIAVDVASERTLADEHVGDEQSGGWLLLRSLLGLRVPVPNLADIQSRLAYVACVESLRRVKEAAEDPESRVKYLRPPVQQFATLEFSQFQAILKAGEAYGREMVTKWRADGTLNRIKGVRDMYAPESHSRATAPMAARAGLTASPSMGHVQGEGDDRRKTPHRRRRSL
jgi:lysophospholipid hydrolase